MPATDPLKRLDQAIAARDRARDHVFQVIREIAGDVRQVDLVKHTGWSREYIRKIVKGEAGPPS